MALWSSLHMTLDYYFGGFLLLFMSSQIRTRVYFNFRQEVLANYIGKETHIQETRSSQQLVGSHRMSESQIWPRTTKLQYSVVDEDHKALRSGILYARVVRLMFFSFEDIHLLLGCCLPSCEDFVSPSLNAQLPCDDFSESFCCWVFLLSKRY